MQQQGESGSTLAIPKILPFLAESIIDLGGMKTEGIFRQAGDPDSIGEMKARLDRGEYHLVSELRDLNFEPFVLKMNRFSRRKGLPIRMFLHHCLNCGYENWMNQSFRKNYTMKD
jgi:hypothetical protein